MAWGNPVITPPSVWLPTFEPRLMALRSRSQFRRIWAVNLGRADDERRGGRRPEAATRHAESRAIVLHVARPERLEICFRASGVPVRPREAPRMRSRAPGARL